MNFTGEWIVRSPFWGEMRLKGWGGNPEKRYQFLNGMDGGLVISKPFPKAKMWLKS